MRRLRSRVFIPSRARGCSPAQSAAVTSNRRHRVLAIPGIRVGQALPSRARGDKNSSAAISWIGDLGGWWDETDFHETRDTAFFLARLEEIWQRVPRYKPLSVGVVLLDLVPADHHQPDLFAADNGRRQKLSPLIDRINDRFGRCAIGFGLFPSDVRAFKGHAAFHRVPEKWEF